MIRPLYPLVSLAFLVTAAHGQQSVHSFDASEWGSRTSLSRLNRADPPRFVEITAGAAHGCGLTVGGEVWCWGANNLGQAGVGEVGGRIQSPTRVAGPQRYVAVAAGAMHTCAITTDHSVACWGFDASGELGRGEAARNCIVGPCSAEPRPVASSRRFDGIVAGHQHSCAISGGEVWCWGSNARGQLGMPDDGERCETSACARAPRRTAELTSVVALTAGGAHSCAIDAGGATWCWGDNRAGQLGIGQPRVAGSARPVRVVSDYRFRSLASGASHTCGLDVDGAIACWGDNLAGQLGAGFTNRSDVPLRESTRAVWQGVSAAARTTCALTPTGETHCWGFGSGNRLGTTPPDSCDAGPCARIATAVPLTSRPPRIAVGGTFACVLATGVVRCWGGADALMNELEDRRLRPQLE